MLKSSVLALSSICGTNCIQPQLFKGKLLEQINQLLAEAQQDATSASDEAMRLMAEFGQDPLLMGFTAEANELKYETRSLRSELQQLQQQTPSATRSINIQVLLARATDLRIRSGRFKAKVMEVSRND